MQTATARKARTALRERAIDGGTVPKEPLAYTKDMERSD
jgi:hypothetical protein